MMSKKWVSAVVGGVLFGATSIAMACGGANSGKHIGDVTAIDSKANTFTIKDMESRKAITFKANSAIMASLKKPGVQVMVNYEEDDEGALKAVGVTF